MSRNVTASSVALLLIFPSFIWIAVDKGVWRGDPVGYALNALSLYQNFIGSFIAWRGVLFNGYKGPLLVWIGQFFVPLGKFIGSINFSLLLVPLLATFITLCLSYKSFELLFKNKVIACCGCLVIVSAPLLNGILTQFWVEPLQVAISAWFIYAMIKAGRWNFYFTLSQFIIALSLAILAKVSSPLYIVGPAIVLWVRVLTSNPPMSLNRKDTFLLLASLFIGSVAGIFYFHNFHDILGYAQYAATSPLYGSTTSQLALLIQALSLGLFLPFTFLLVIVIWLWGTIKIFKLQTYSHFGNVFITALFQIGLFFVVWLRSSNDDPRLFLPILPYCAVLICWGLVAINNRMVTAVSVSMFLLQFVMVTSFAFGITQLPSCYGMIRPLINEQDRDMHIIHDIMPLATRDSSIIFDLNPELGLAEFQYELAKQNLLGNWHASSIDIAHFFNFNHQQIDTGKIKVETVWQNVLAFKPDYYITWNWRLSSMAAEKEICRIDKYNAATVRVRWAIAGKINNSKLYEVVPFAAYPELLVYKRNDIPLINQAK